LAPNLVAREVIFQLILKKVPHARKTRFLQKIEESATFFFFFSIFLLLSIYL